MGRLFIASYLSKVLSSSLFS